MSKIPNDIVNRLKKDYPNPNDYEDALDVVNHVKNDTLNVLISPSARIIIERTETIEKNWATVNNPEQYKLFQPDDST